VVPASTDAGQNQGLAAVVIWCLPASSLARGPGAHPAGPVGEVRSGAAETDEVMEDLLVFVAGGRGTRALPEPAGQVVVLGAHVASWSFPGGFGHGWRRGRPILTS
jgi:hypothetical protein